MYRIEGTLKKASQVFRKRGGNQQRQVDKRERSERSGKYTWALLDPCSLFLLLILPMTSHAEVLSTYTVNFGSIEAHRSSMKT